MALKPSPPSLPQAFTVHPSHIPHILIARASKNNPLRTPVQRRRQQSTASRALPPHPSRPPRSSTLPRPAHAHPRSNAAPPSPGPASSRDKRAIYVASLFGFSFALYLSFLYVGVSRDWERSKQLASELGPDADVSDRWDAIGRNYDDEIDVAETMMFLGSKRQQLVSQAKGEVLEVSVGTGRNMRYYDLNRLRENSGRQTEKEEKQEKQEEGRVKRLAFNDKSGVMVDAARKKFEELERMKGPAQRFKGRVEFVVGDAGAQGMIEKPEKGFDTIVQTMGLCSTRDPVGLLKRLGELCKKPTGQGKAEGSGGGSGKQTDAKVVEGKYSKGIVKDAEEYDGGRILLLEHGRGYYDWLNHVLDGLAPAHADHYGCWWNRDIGAIVEQSGLETEYIKRYHLGTTWEVVLRPKVEQETPLPAESDGQKSESESESESESKSKSKSKSKSSGIFGWVPRTSDLVGQAMSGS